MTLHEAIEKLLQQKGRPMTTTEIASELNNSKWYQKKDGSLILPFQIHGRTNNYLNIFNRDGSTVSLADKSLKHSKNSQPIKKIVAKIISGDNDSDENYVIDLCDKVLGIKASRQHKFDFLTGDANSQGRSVRLPVDAFYKELNLAIEYRERQHTEEVRFFDKPNKMTVSGVHRGEQRKLYDQKRREVLPKNGIELIEISYSDFNHDGQKRIIRDKKQDIEVIENRLKKKNGSQHAV
jgi:hypothetical protein